MKIILAHGVFGPFDELMYVAPEFLFVVSMIFSWIRFRKTPDDRPPDDPANESATTEENDPDS